jgi:hypothetical protein
MLWPRWVSGSMCTTICACVCVCVCVCTVNSHRAHLAPPPTINNMLILQSLILNGNVICVNRKHLYTNWCANGCAYIINSKQTLHLQYRLFSKVVYWIANTHHIHTHAVMHCLQHGTVMKFLRPDTPYPHTHAYLIGHDIGCVCMCACMCMLCYCNTISQSWLLSERFCSLCNTHIKSIKYRR